MNHLELAIRTKLTEHIDIRETVKTTITNLFNVQSSARCHNATRKCNTYKNEQCGQQGPWLALWRHQDMLP